MDCTGVGIIGAGERGCYILGTRIAELYQETGLFIAAVCDANSARTRDAKTYLERMYKELGIQEEIEIFESHKDLIASERVGIIMITTHTDNHREPAVDALRSGKTTYLDKPIAVEPAESAEILACEQETGNRLIMGFTRRYEAGWRKAYELVQEGEIGELKMIQIRSIIPYFRYFQMWHRKSSRSGGALNDKSSHHFDVLAWFAGSGCQSLSGIGGRSGIFPPDPNAPLRCSLCDRDCLYRRELNPADQQEGTQVLGYPSWAQAEDERSRGDTCVYQPGADIIDHAVVNLFFENGVSASLFWSIFGPASKDQETLELVGSLGRIYLSRSEGIVRLCRIGREELVFDVKDENFLSSHYGADIQLIQDLKAFHQGEKAVAEAKDGHNSLLLVTAALESIEDKGRRIEITGWKGEAE